MADEAWRSALRRRRERAGMSQASLASEVGVSRQALTAIEAGRQIPSTSLALALARALDCRVEDLFSLGPPAAVDVEPVDPGLVAGRVFVGRVADRWVAHAAPHGASTADAILEAGSRARPLDAWSRLERNVLVAGCAPLLGTLAGRVGGPRREVTGRWLWANSERALALLAAGQVHVAGVHLAGEGVEHATLVRARIPDEASLIVNLARWRQGLLLPLGDAGRIRTLDDALRPGIRFARREPGAGAAKLLAGRPAPEGPLAHTHDEVAQLVRAGAADVGVATEGAAHAAGLGFVPLSEERFDLVVRSDIAREAPVARLLDVLSDSGFLAEAAAMGGYDLGLTGSSATVSR